MTSSYDYALTDFASYLADVEQNFGKKFLTVIETFSGSRVDLPMKRFDEIAKVHDRASRYLRKSIDVRKSDSLNLWKLCNVYSLVALEMDKRFLKDERKQEKLPRNPATTRDSNEAMAEAQSLPSEAINLPSWTSYKEEATVSQTESLSAMRPPRPPRPSAPLFVTSGYLSNNQTPRNNPETTLISWEDDQPTPAATRNQVLLGQMAKKLRMQEQVFPFSADKKRQQPHKKKRQNSDEVPPTLISIDCTPPVPTMRSYFSKIEPLQAKSRVGIVLEDVDPRRRATSQKMNGSMTSTTTTTSTASQNQEYIVVNNVTNFAVEPDRATYAPPSLGP
ncbi:unnamed protein product [Caenorhabditis auriculariae]|uniref:Uncharacterized protein n=1 Tax=Caenorhabditis auriculariae TaxID=2777116 RepID=A0A8S1H6M8_9PELO|nr:unnamed protein product [Caenorhabditis auriculariae]